MSLQDFTPEEIPMLIRLPEQGERVELYRHSRVKIGEGWAAPPVEPGYNFNINRWVLYTPDSTYFLPIDELASLYINTLLEAFDKMVGIFVVDE